MACRLPKALQLAVSRGYLFHGGSYVTDEWISQNEQNDGLCIVRLKARHRLHSPWSFWPRWHRGFLYPVGRSAVPHLGGATTTAFRSQPLDTSAAKVALPSSGSVPRPPPILTSCSQTDYLLLRLQFPASMSAEV